MADTEPELTLKPADRKTFSAAMSRFATGVAVLTACHDGQPFAATVSALTSLSLDPCQLLVCVPSATPTGNAIKASGRFALSLLDRNQHDVAKAIVDHDAEALGAIEWAADAAGLPIVGSAIASVSCRLVYVVTSGDHNIMIGEVDECRQREGEPLVAFGGGFGSFANADRRDKC
jgi:3-hydroxy-9,10-secoandrosta-1,3,5(10)-triene-9,17-dione monooxygenase reductase component